MINNKRIYKMEFFINKKAQSLTLLILAILFFISCTERIEIELDTTYSRLVIEGQVTTDTTRHLVMLSHSTDYYNPLSPVGVSDAIVTINDGFETVTLAESETNPGYYETDPGYFGIVGRTYTLNVELQEAINETTSYTATSKLKFVGPIDSIGLGYRDRFNATEVKIYAWEPPTEDFYKFDIIKNGILLTDTINKAGITDDRFFNGNYTNGVPVYFLRDDEPDQEVQVGDTITLKMSGITKEYYNFIQDLQLETFEFSNPLFSGPPANISTNLSGGAVGFFTAFSSSYASVVATEIEE